MDEIKRRIVFINQHLEKMQAGYNIIDVELLCLQFRKILEIIALGSLVANRKLYERARAKFENDWCAPRIFAVLEKVNPDFYPIPGQQRLDTETGKPVELEKYPYQYLTKDDFFVVYNACSNMLHAQSPYDTVPIDLQWYRAQFLEWREKIIALLSHHQIQLPDDNQQWWVIMQAQEDGKVHLHEMVRIED